MKSLHFISLGCPKNLVDSEVMLGHLAEEGFSFTDDPYAADVIVVNTCAFIEDARKEAIDAILEMGIHRREGRCRLLIVAGCLPQRYKGELAKLLPEVDIFVGAGEFWRIAEILKEREALGNSRSGMIRVGNPQYLYDHETPRMVATPRHTAYIKIAEGCFHPCSFCIIPKLRGKFRSRDPKSVVSEAKDLLSAGALELNLIAQDSTAYGRDIGFDIAALMEEVASLPGIKWIRLLYAYPHEFPVRLIEVIRDCPDICKYVDIPIQHISERILRSMRRKGDGAEIRDLIEKLRKEIPGVFIRTSLIAGYPGETKAEFAELMGFIRESRFEHMGVFTFSPEEGTPAARLKGRISSELAERRRAEAMELQREISLANNRRLVGRRLQVLVDGISPESELLIEGRHEGQAPDIDGVIYINEGEPRPGSFATVEVTEAHEYDLIGKMVV